MKRSALLLALLPALLAAGAAPAAAEPRAEARVTECRTALTAADRFLVVQGRMATLRGAARMQMRFDLQVRAPGWPRWSTVTAPGFGVWNSADVTARRYVHSKRVENLTAPGSFRMVVRFRWRDSDGRRMAVVRRVTRRCRQPDLRPDLEPGRLTAAPGPAPAERLYLVSVRNRGRSAAGPFAVSLVVGGVAQPSGAVTGLAAGEERVVQIVAPACQPGSVIDVRVDADASVDESDESDNQRLRTCPVGQERQARMDGS